MLELIAVAFAVRMVKRAADAVSKVNDYYEANPPQGK